jgi:hypothetical protein
MKNKKNEGKLLNLFKPKLWKILLSIISMIISYFYFGPKEILTINDFNGPTVIYKYAPIGIRNLYVFMLISVIFFYLIFSFVGGVVQMIKHKVKR